MEDSRISTDGHEAVSHDLVSGGRDENLASDISAHPSLQLSQNADVAEFQLAQAAEQQANGKTDRIAANEPQQAGSQQSDSHQSVQVTPEQGNIVHLPANTSIDDIHVEGRNLVLVQADGTRVVIVNGALHVPTFLIGEVTLPQQAVVAALQQQGVNVAEGPDGSYHAGNATSSGADFNDGQAGNARTPLNLIGLLGPGGGFGNGNGANPEGVQNGLPFINTALTASASVVEAADANGLFSSQSSTGRFGFGGHNASISTVTLVGEVEITGDGTQQLTGLTSGGLAVTATQTGNTVTGVTSAGNVAFTLVFDPATGNYTFTQFAAFDHPAGANAKGSDVLELQFQYTVTDKSGHTVSAVATVDITDSVPVAAGGTEGSADEGALKGGNDAANHIAGSASATGSLNISWGADSANTDKGGLGDRSVAFTDAHVGLQGAADGALTSHGAAVNTVVLADGTLIGYTGDAPESITSANVVFYAKLSDTGNGSYSFTLVQSLDHASGNSPLTLTFDYTAKDSDGDTASSTFAVSIADDVPVANNVVASGDLYDTTGDSGSTTPVLLEAVLVEPSEGSAAPSAADSVQGAAGSLFTAGADGFKDLSFTPPEGLKGIYTDENGHAVVGDLSYATTHDLKTGEAVYTASVDGHVIFTLTVETDGSYTFQQLGALYHDNGKEAGTDTQLNVDIGFTVTDGDGDASTGSLTVTVQDSTPISAGDVSASADVTDTLAAKSSVPGGVHLLFAAPSDSVSGDSGALFNAGADGFAKVTFTDPTGLKAIYVDSHGVAHQVSVQFTTEDGANGTTVYTAYGQYHGVDFNVFTLTVGADGSYTYQQLGALVDDKATSDESVTVKIGFTVTDGDGDTAGGSLSLTVDDTTPTVSVDRNSAFSVTLDETAGRQRDSDDTRALSAFAHVANVGNDPDVHGNRPLGYAQSDAPALTVSDIDFGADGKAAQGAKVYSLSLSASGVDSGLETTSGQHIYLYDEHGIIVGRVDNADGSEGKAAFAIAIDASTGQVSTVEYLSLQQPNDVTHNGDAVVSIAADLVSAVLTVKDGDGDTYSASADISSGIQFKDDGPTLSVAKNGSFSVTDDEAGTMGKGIDLSVFANLGIAHYQSPISDATSSASALQAQIDYGADGKGSAVYSLQLNGGTSGIQPLVNRPGSNLIDSGLQTTDGKHIYLFEQDGVIIGRVGSDHGQVAFAIAIDPATGQITTAEYVSLHQPGINDANDIVSIATGKISAVLTVTDGDGSTNSASADISSGIQFKDAGPHITSLTLGSADVTEGSYQAPRSGYDQAIRAIFGDVGHVGTDPDTNGKPVAFIQKAGFATSVADFGADGAANSNSVAYSLTLADPAAGKGVDSGLQTTDGHEIYLFKEGDLIVGRYDTNGGSVSNKGSDPAAFAIAISQNGTLSIVEYVSLKDVDAQGKPVDAIHLASGAVSVTVTATDGDGDTDSKSVDLSGAVNFVDDTPTARAASDVHVTEGTPVSGNVFSTSDAGADGAHLTSVKIGDTTINLSATHTTDTIVTAQGTYTFNYDGSWTLNAARNLNNADGIQSAFKFTITDNDGDKSNATQTVTILDGATPDVTGSVALSVSEAALANGTTPASTAEAASSGNGNALTFTAHSDDITGIAFGSTSGIVVSGLASNEKIVWVSAGNGNLEGHLNSANGTLLITLSLSGTLTATGEGATAKPVITATLNHALDDASNASSISIKGITIVATDTDGDTATGTVNVTVVDDVPVAGTAAAGSIREHVLTSAPDDVSGSLNINFGADGAASKPVTFVTQGSGNSQSYVTMAGHDANNNSYAISGLKSGGQDIHFTTINNGTTIVAYVGNSANNQSNWVFSVTLSAGTDSKGAYDFTLYKPLDDVTTKNNALVNLSDIEFKFAVQGSDSDGDKTATETFTVKVTDDTSVTSAVAAQSVHEGAASTSVSNVSLGIQWGADGAKSVGFNTTSPAGNVVTSAALYSNGQALSYAVIAGLLVAYTGTQPTQANATNVVFTVALSADANGSYSFKLLQPLDHSGAIGSDGSHAITIGFNYTATDGDNDAATGSFSVNVNAAGTVSGQTIDYSALTSGVVVNLSDSAATVGNQTVAAHTAQDAGSGHAVGIDNVSGIANVTGTSSADTIVTGSGQTIVHAGGGDDTIVLRPDIADAGSADVRSVTLGDGIVVSHNLGGLAGTSDQIYGEGGTDTVILDKGQSNGFVLDASYPSSPAFAGIEKVIGSDGNDVIMMPSNYKSDDASTNGGVTIDGGKGDDFIVGGAGNDTLIGGDGNDTIVAGKGSDTITGGAGSDTIYYQVGSGNDRIDGGASTSDGKTQDVDTLHIVGDGSAHSFTIGEIAASDDGNIKSADDHADLTVTIDGHAAPAVRADGIEDLVFDLNSSAGNTIKFGDVSDTALAPQTITLNTGAGNDTFDMTGLTGNVHIVINDGDAVTGGDTDTLKLAGKWADWTVTQSGDVYTLTNGDETISVTNVEQFSFAGDNGGKGVTIPLSDLLNIAPQATDFVVGSVKEDTGASAEKISGSVLHDGDATDGNIANNKPDIDTLVVTGVLAGSASSADADNVGGKSATVIDGTYGKLTIFADGYYTFTLADTNAATNALSEGEKTADVFNYTVADAHGLESSATLTINVTGTNDKPVAAAQVATVQEDVILTTQDGNLLSGAADVDAQDTLSIAKVGTSTDDTQPVSGAYGTLTWNSETGAYTYTLHNDDAAVQHLIPGETLTDSFTFVVTDNNGGTDTQTLVVTINGSDDAPVIIGQSVNGHAVASNLLADGDFTQGAASAWTDGGGYQWATAGTGWTIAGTADGQTGVRLEKIDSGYDGVTSSNGAPMVDLGATPGNVSIAQTVHGLTAGSYTLSFEYGTPDGGTASVEVIWNGNVVATLTPTPGSGALTLESLNLTALAGDNTIEFREVGNASDNTGTYLANIGLTASASVPVITAAATENGVQTFAFAEGTQYSYGADGKGDTGHVTVETGKAVVSGPEGVALGQPAISYDAASGQITLAPGTAFDALAAGEIAKVSIPFEVTDRNGTTTAGVYELTITGTNDAPQIALVNGDAVAGSVTEQGANVAGVATATGHISSTDVDHGDTATWSIVSGNTTASSVQGAYGTLSINAATGQWTYTIDEAKADTLAAGQQKQEIFTVDVTDSQGAIAQQQVVVTVNGSNDAPSVAIDATVANSGNEDTAIAIKGLSVHDVDAGSNAITVTLSVNDGALNITGAPSSVTVGSNGTGTVTLTGSQADINAVLASKVGYTDSLNHNGDVTLTISATDDKGAASASQSMTIHVNPVNDAPTLSGTSAVSYTENAAGKVINASLTVNDVDNTTLHGATVSITGNFAAGQDALNFVNQHGITGSYNANTGVLTLTGDATVAQYQAALDSITYSNSSENPSTATRTISFTVTDGDLTSTPVTSTVAVVAVNDAPTGADNHISINETANYTFQAADFGFSDTDGNSLSAVKITTLPSGGILYDGNQVVTAGQSISLADINGGKLVFKPTANFAGSSADASFQFKVQDNGGTANGGVDTSASANTMTVHITAVDDGKAVISMSDNNSAAHSTYLVGDVLTAGLVSNDADHGQTATSYVWTRIDSQGHSTTISGATGSSYTLTTADIGYKISVTENYTDGQGFSDQSNTVQTATSVIAATVAGANIYTNAGSLASGAASAQALAWASGAAAGDVTGVTQTSSTVQYQAGGTIYQDKISSADGAYDYRLSGFRYEVGVVMDHSNDATADILVGSRADSDFGNLDYVELHGGSGNDVLIGGSSSSSFENDLYGNDGNDLLIGGSGSKVSDYMDGGAGDDTLISTGGTDKLTGGAGNDTFLIQAGTASIVDLSGGDVVNVSAGATASIEATGDWSATNSTVNKGTVSIDANGHDIDLSLAGGSNGWTVTNSSNAATLVGSSYNDTITGGSGNDVIIGGKGADSLDGGGGKDTFAYYAGDTALSLSGSTLSGYDTISNFSASNSTRDTLMLAGTNVHLASGSASGSSTNNSDLLATTSWTSGHTLFTQSSSIDGYSISNGMISFTGSNGHAVTISSMADVAAVVQFLERNSIGTAGSTIAFTASFGGGHTFVFEQVGSGADRLAGNDILVDLSGTTLTSSNLTTVIQAHSSAIDPVVLDLDHNGIALTSQANGVSFDLNADGVKDQVAWTAAGAHDGILAIDLNHDGQINNGSELFTTTFNGGNYADGMAALASLDTNHDGKIDAADTAYSQLSVWQDLNHNGIADAGEVTTLAQQGIASISLTTTPSETTIAGQSVLAEGTFTSTDGSTGHLAEVAFDTSLGQTDAGQINLIGSDGNDTLTSGGGYTMTGGAGSDTFVLDAQALHNLNMADVITDFSPKGDGDKLDVSNLLNALVSEHPGMTDAQAVASMTAVVNTATNSTAISVNTGSETHVVATLQNYAPTGQDAVHVLFNNHDEQLATHSQTAGA